MYQIYLEKTHTQRLLSFLRDQQWNRQLANEYTPQRAWNWGANLLGVSFEQSCQWLIVYCKIILLLSSSVPFRCSKRNTDRQSNANADTQFENPTFDQDSIYDSISKAKGSSVAPSLAQGEWAWFTRISAPKWRKKRNDQRGRLWLHQQDISSTQWIGRK